MNAPMTTIVKGVQQHELAAVWPVAAPFIAKALEYAHGDWDLASVRLSLEEGVQPRRQLFVTWPTIEAVLLTEIDHRPGGAILVICACAGRLSTDWREILLELEGWGASQGCRAAELRGRLGWERRLPDYTRHALLRKELQWAE